MSTTSHFSQYMTEYTLNRHKNSPFLSTIFLFAMFWIFYWYYFLRGCLEQSCSLLSTCSRVSNFKKKNIREYDFFKPAMHIEESWRFSWLFRTVRYRERVCQWSQAWEPNPPVSSKRCAAVPACTARAPPAASPTVSTILHCRTPDPSDSLWACFEVPLFSWALLVRVSLWR